MLFEYLDSKGLQNVRNPGSEKCSSKNYLSQEGLADKDYLTVK
jgi:hypothetical protein